jgi:hypothetical protein
MKFENALQPDVKNLKNVFGKDFHGKNFDYPEKPLKYKHIRRISD